MTAKKKRSTSGISIFNITALIFSLIIFSFTQCTENQKYNHLTQISTIDAVIAGHYDGIISCDNLLDHGDFGIGTFDRLDGEMIVHEGRIFQARSDGRVVPVESNSAPFASVCFFSADRIVKMESEMSFQTLKTVLDSSLENHNTFYAVKIEGFFQTVHVRSVPAQKKPYPPLVKVAENQPEFHYRNISGVLIGFRCPVYVRGINVPGYHLHFISDDLKHGGHVLEFDIQKTECHIDELNRFTLILPEDDDSGDFQMLDLSKDRSEDLEKVESR